jgi:hypothetical protein
VLSIVIATSQSDSPEVVVRRLDAGIILAQARSSYRIGADGGATLQLQIVGRIIYPPEFVEQAVLVER